MGQILVEHDVSPAKLDMIGVYDWPVWSKEVSVFPWTYAAPETCYLLEGEAIVTPNDGTPVRIAAGDLVRFPAGLSCTWDIRVPVHKHYRLA